MAEAQPELKRTEQTHTLAINPNIAGSLVLMRDEKHTICKQKPDPAVMLNSLNQPVPVSIFCGSHCPLFILNNWIDDQGEQKQTTVEINCGCRPIRFTIREGEAKKDTPVLTFVKQ